MTNNEWNKVMQYAKELCEKSSADVRPIEYTDPCGGKGIFLTLFENNKPVNRIATGIGAGVDTMKICLNNIFREIEYLAGKKEFKENRSPLLKFITINVDGVYRGWQRTIEDLRKEYFSEDCDLPANDDRVIDFDIYGTQMYFNTFGDVVAAFGIAGGCNDGN